MKVAAVCTHPIQYYTPWFKGLAARVDLKVFYALLPDRQQQSVGFGGAFEWDIPLLEGYDWELLPNARRKPTLRGFLNSSTPSIKSALERFQPDAAIITGWQSLPLIQATIACIRLGIPRVVRGESNDLRQRPLPVRLMHRALLNRFDAMLAIGKMNRTFYLGYGISPERMFGCPYFVDNDRFQQQIIKDKAQSQDFRSSWRIPESSTCFLFAGKLEPKKRIMDLMRAMEAAGKKCQPFHLLVAGTGEQMDEARGFAEAAKRPVTFAGFLNQTEITRAYAAADCLVLPSDYGETWGLVVNEAMACGLPAIVSDRVGCGPDLVEDRVTGAVFPFGDVEALARWVVQFASNRSQLEQMGAAARERVKAYSVEAAVDGTLKSLEYAVGTRQRPSAGAVPSPSQSR